MKIESESGGVIFLELSKVQAVSMRILTLFAKTPESEAVLGCALTVARVANPGGKELSEDEELAFLKAFGEWLDTYFAVPEGGISH